MKENLIIFILACSQVSAIYCKG